jgi:uncharacterized metal-binding protein YceD (DUF177 family)
LTPEFSRPERLDTIGDHRAVTVVADAAELGALAVRFDLVGVEGLSATFTVDREAGAIRVVGRVRASVTQACTVTGDPVTAAVDEEVAVRFVPAGTFADGEEVELAADAVDTIEIDAGAIDLGELAAETMALALDPFPRAPGAEAALREAGVLSEADRSPFAGLAALRDRLNR